MFGRLLCQGGLHDNRKIICEPGGQIKLAEKRGLINVWFTLHGGRTQEVVSTLWGSCFGAAFRRRCDAIATSCRLLFFVVGRRRCGRYSDGETVLAWQA